MRAPLIRERLLLLLWLPVWAAAFLHSASHFREPHGILPVKVASAASRDAYPVVTGNRDWAGRLAEEARPGDLLVRVGETELRGASSLDAFFRFAAAGRAAASVPAVLERDGVRLEMRFPSNQARFLRVWVVVSAIYAVVAVLLLWRAPPSGMVRAFFHAFMAEAVVFAACPDGLVPLVVESLALGLGCAFSLLAFQRFPEDRRLGWLGRTLPWLFMVLAPLHAIRFGAPPAFELAEPLAVVAVFALFVGLLAVTTSNYRSADAIGRRQIRWVLLGLYLAALPPMFTAALVTIEPSWTEVYGWNLAASGMVPLSVLISVVRYGLFDIDRVLSATASYNLLLAVAFVASLVLIPQAGDLAASRLGLDAGLSRLAVAIALAAILMPAQGWLRPRLERIFFRERWDLDKGITELIREVRECEDASELTTRVGSTLVRLLRPELCAVYGRREEGFVPVFVRGRAVPPGFDGKGSLATALSQQAGPLDVEAALGRRRLALDPFEHAALETLGAALLLPIRARQLDAFVVLGRKRSGDIYTSTDHAMLARLADQVAAQLRGYDQEALVRESRALQEKLRRYVPGAVAQQLASGREAVSGACEVSVLFVDIRGYTRFAEGRPSDEIFSTLNRYTQIVSKHIAGRGGSVVEFNGDGLMAVFGAPNRLPDKERSALAAAREIVRALGAGDADGGPIPVGVGIATGEAYVGDIRSADRMIWSAVGNTTNLAARLQQLTRDWDAAIVIDARTFEAAGAAAAGFEARGHTAIRGRREQEPLYALPLASVA